jgi:multidrug efflux system outer membrane protein
MPRNAPCRHNPPQLNGGTVNLVTVLQTEQTLFSAESALVQIRLNRALAATSLFQALGGGWNKPVLAAVPAPRHKDDTAAPA